jgi:hypothetical protein
MSSPELESTAAAIAERGRDALVERLRRAYSEAAAAHADLLQLDAERIDAMVQRAVQRADGLQWRRAMASAGASQLGISVAQALTHPAVERAQALAGAPSYEQELVALRRETTAPRAEPAPRPGPEPERQPEPQPEPEPAAGLQTPPEPEPQPEPESESEPQPEPEPESESESEPQPEPEQWPESARQPEPEPRLEPDSRPEPDTSRDSDPLPASRPALKTGLETKLEPEPEPEPESEREPETEPEARADGRTTPVDEEPGAGEREVDARETDAHGADEGDEDADDDDHDDYEDDDYEAADGTLGEASTAGGRLQQLIDSLPRYPEDVRVSAIHRGGVADLLMDDRIDLRVSGDGFDIIGPDDMIIGRLGWSEIDDLLVPEPASRRERRRAVTRLVVQTKQGDASFEVASLSREALREQLRPLRAYFHLS